MPPQKVKKKSATGLTPRIEEAGNRYGKLLVIKAAKFRQSGHIFWHCHCDCGKNTVVSGCSLRSGKSRSCGCARIPPIQAIDETGNRYGRLLVIKKAQKRKRSHACWHCRCDCGKNIIVDGCQLRRGDTASCGCYQRECAGNITRGTRRPKNVRAKVSKANKGRTRVYRRDGTWYMEKKTT